MENFINSLSPFIKILLLGSVILPFFVLIFLTQVMNVMVEIMNKNGFGYLIIKARNIVTILMMLLIAGVILALLIYGLSIKNTAMQYFLFSAFPYVALFAFILGSIYRYRNRGFQVSSLSSQFLEGRQLFWGSQPFHWSLIILFFGHLIAFMFPKIVLAWNGEPVRLLILEISSFAFGLSALFGLILLITRRLSSKRILMVTNKMDLLVYIVLLVQIISGLSVAFFVRWGSSWFAAVLTPYLKSVILINPETEAIRALPWLVQLHIISAFFIIAIIPFTRFMHFLVAPLDYVWRSYQLVYWNWNRRVIRSSNSLFPGWKSENH